MFAKDAKIRFLGGIEVHSGEIKTAFSGLIWPFLEMSHNLIPDAPNPAFLAALAF
jgi:hypothetical protein